MPAHLVGVGVPDDPLLPCGGMGHAALHAAIRSYVGRGALTPPQAFALPVSFRGVEDAAPYAGGCPLTGSRANLRRGVGTPPYGWNSRKR